MRILYIAHFDCTTNEGNSAHVGGVVRALVALGNEVTLLAPNWISPPQSRIRYIHVARWRRAGFNTITFALMCLPVLFWQLWVQRPEIVYTRFFNTLWLLIPVLRVMGVPFVVEVNADQSSEHLAYGRNQLRRSFWSFAESAVYRRAAGLVAVVPAISASIRRRFPELNARIAIIENGVDTTKFAPQEATACRRALGLDPTAHYVTYVGMFQPWQGLSTLIEAAPGILATWSDIIFLLVGSQGAEHLQLLSGIADSELRARFIFPGSCPPHLAASYIGSADVCVAPYNHLVALPGEGMGWGAPMKGSPLKVFSYMACARPVVASHFREAGAFVQDLGAGLAIPPDDPVALCDAIVALLGNPTLRTQMGELGRAAVQAHHSWEAVALRLIAFLTELVSG